MHHLFDLLAGLAYKRIEGNDRVVISSVVYDSRMASAGSLFVCIRGFVSDGHRYIDQAVEKGATAVLMQDYQCYFS